MMFRFKLELHNEQLEIDKSANFKRKKKLCFLSSISTCKHFVQHQLCNLLQ